MNRRFLDALAESATDELHRHHRERRSWSYHDILTRECIAELARRPPATLDDDVAYCYLANLVVEKGHAEYDRVASNAFEVNHVFRSWKNTCVAEEEPHGAAMLEWAKVRGTFAPGLAHAATQGYLRNGLTFRSTDPAFVLAYAALQEAATRITHKAVKDRLPPEELEGRRILSSIIADEERHERFYVNMVRHALASGDREIASHQMVGLTAATLGFEMPGIEHDIPDAGRLLRAYAGSGIFTLRRLADEVLVPAVARDGRYGWNVAAVEGLDDRAARSRDSLLAFAVAATDARSDRHLLVLLGRARRSVHALM